MTRSWSCFSRCRHSCRYTAISLMLSRVASTLALNPYVTDPWKEDMDPRRSRPRVKDISRRCLRAWRVSSDATCGTPLLGDSLARRTCSSSGLLWSSPSSASSSFLSSSPLTRIRVQPRPLVAFDSFHLGFGPGLDLLDPLLAIFQLVVDAQLKSIPLARAGLGAKVPRLLDPDREMDIQHVHVLQMLWE
jgi:hypothetical protein